MNTNVVFDEEFSLVRTLWIQKACFNFIKHPCHFISFRIFSRNQKSSAIIDYITQIRSHPFITKYKLRLNSFIKLSDKQDFFFVQINFYKHHLPYASRLAIFSSLWQHYAYYNSFFSRFFYYLLIHFIHKSDFIQILIHHFQFFLYLLRSYIRYYEYWHDQANKKTASM